MGKALKQAIGQTTGRATPVEPNQKASDSFRHEESQCISVLKERLQYSDSCEFTREISQELRSILMVFQGALALLKSHQHDDQLQCQKNRLSESAEDMKELIDTLLAMQTDTSESLYTPVVLNKSELVELVNSQKHLLNEATTTLEITIVSLPKMGLPTAPYRTLLKLLVRAIFKLSEAGYIKLSVSNDCITISETSDQTEFVDLALSNEFSIISSICTHYRFTYKSYAPAINKRITKLNFPQTIFGV